VGAGDCYCEEGELVERFIDCMVEWAVKKATRKTGGVTTERRVISGEVTTKFEGGQIRYRKDIRLLCSSFANGEYRQRSPNKS
jgi:hypothetical protein